MTKSANDIAVTVAENLAGTEQEFAEQIAIALGRPSINIDLIGLTVGF